MKHLNTSRLSSIGLPLLIGALVFAFGWLAIRCIWEVWYQGAYGGQHSFPYYLSANWGDSLILPVLCGLLVQELRPLSRLYPIRLKVVVASLLGAAGGAISQYSWTHSGRTTLNWTFDGEGHFNAAGWYHAGFLVLMSAVLSGGLVALVVLGRSQGRWERLSVIRHLAIGYLLVLFACLLATDNRRSISGLSGVGGTDLLAILAMPLVCMSLVGLVGLYLRATPRLILIYSIVLAGTSVSVPVALLARGLSPVSVGEVVSCVGATVFAANFVTAPASSSLLEQYLRSIPVAVVSMVFALLLSAPLQGNSWFFTASAALGAMLAVWLSSVAPCLFDSPTREWLTTAMSGVLLVIMSAISSFVSGANHLAVNSLSTVIPVVTVLLAANWVRDNFGVVTAREVAAASEARGGQSSTESGRDALSKQRLLRYKVLVGFIVHAALVMLFNVWVRLESSTNSNWGSPWRLLFCLLLLLVMMASSGAFSALSVRDNVFAMRGLKVDLWARRRVTESATLVSLLSLSYGVALFFFSSTRTSLLGWLAMLAMYLLAMLGACVTMMRGIDGARRRVWPCVSSPWAGIQQDHMLSLVLFNSLGLGVPLWISDRFADPRDLLTVVGWIMVPLAAVFLFFLHNNMSHVRNQEREVRSVIDRDPSVDSVRAEAYLEALKRHCAYQNRIMLAAAFLALSIYVVLKVILETVGLQSSEGSLGIRRLIGGEDWTSLPSLAEVVADD